MAMQAKIDTSPKHGAMTRALRINWVKTRWVVTFFSCCITSPLYSASLDQSNAVTADEDDFQVVLD